MCGLTALDSNVSSIPHALPLPSRRHRVLSKSWPNLSLLSSFICESTLQSGCEMMASVNGRALQVQIQKYPLSQPHPWTPCPSGIPPFLKKPGTFTSPSAPTGLPGPPGQALYPPAIFQGQVWALLPSLPSLHQSPSPSACIYLHPAPLRNGFEAGLLIGNPHLAFITETHIWAFLGEPQCQVRCLPIPTNAWQNNENNS